MSAIICVLLQENTFQAILITNGTYSYTVFTYQCGLLQWDNGVTIGFNAASEKFDNHNPSGKEVACLNTPNSDWTNIVYLLSSNTDEPPPPSTSSRSIHLFRKWYRPSSFAASASIHALFHLYVCFIYMQQL